MRLVLGDFDVAKLWKSVKKRRVKAHDLAQFPAVRRDLALVVSKSVAYETLKVTAEKPSELLKGVELFDVYEGKGSTKARRATPWRSPCRTLTPR